MAKTEAQVVSAAIVVDSDKFLAWARIGAAMDIARALARFPELAKDFKLAVNETTNGDGARADAAAENQRRIADQETIATAARRRKVVQGDKAAIKLYRAGRKKKGTGRRMSPAARKKISDQVKARWAAKKANGEKSL